MREWKFPFVILSAEMAGCADYHNRERTDSLQDVLMNNGMHFRIVGGSYGGREEVSFIVVLRDAEDLDRVCSLAKYWGQESVLHVDATRHAELIFPDLGRRESVGAFVERDEATARRHGAWTYVAGRFYVCEAYLREPASKEN
jgi:hypothetical protein